MEVFADVIKSNYKDELCYVSKDIIKKLSIVQDSSYTMKFGRCEAKIKIKALGKSSQSTIKINHDISSRLAIPENLYTGIAMVDNEIVLGPVLGVFVNPSYIRDLKAQSPRPSSLHLLKANENSNLFIYFFTIDKADWLNNKLEGWYYSASSNAWEKKWLPLPDVVYDRGVGFYTEEKPLLDQFRNQFTPAGSITRINSTDCLDKYWLHERIKHHRDISQYLPETVRYNSFDDLSPMLKKHKVLYLKSFYGSCGTEVMTVKSRAGNNFECSYFDSDNLKHKTVDGTDNLSALIDSFFKDINFIVQQGIDLLEYNGSRLDMRILIQKNGDGIWTSVYNVVIKGIRNSLITAGEEKGARFFNFTEIMPLVLNMPNDKVAELDKQVRQACINVARAIEEEYGPFGEIGMDMALDKNLKIWFIEANSKPDRELENGIIGSARVRATCLNIIEYTKYLAGFH